MRRSIPAFSFLSCGLLIAGSVIAQAPTYSKFGVGCPGTSGLPVLEAPTDMLPCIGDTFVLKFSNLPSGHPSPGLFVLLGFSFKNWGSIPLPADLGPFGMPGCSWQVSMRQATFVPYTGTIAYSYLPIADDGKHLQFDGCMQHTCFPEIP